MRHVRLHKGGIVVVSGHETPLTFSNQRTDFWWLTPRAGRLARQRKEMWDVVKAEPTNSCMTAETHDRVGASELVDIRRYYLR